MSDAEAVADFMEPRPADFERGERGLSAGGWWRAVFAANAKVFRWFPNSDKSDSLDALRAVEARLTEEQWKQYWWNLADAILPPGDSPTPKVWLHATAEQKLAALAAALRT